MSAEETTVTVEVTVTRTTHRGTTNRNDRGSSYQRRKRKDQLVLDWRANVSRVSCVIPPEALTKVHGPFSDVIREPVDGLIRLWTSWGYTDIAVEPLCRCWRCGRTLDATEVVADRFPVPGCEGGRYVRGNMRPQCGPCSEWSGGKLAAERKAAKR